MTEEYKKKIAALMAKIKQSNDLCSVYLKEWRAK